MLVGLVVGAKGIDGVNEGQAPLNLGHVGRQLVVLDRHHQVLAHAQGFGGTSGALPQHTPKALPFSDALYNLH